MMKLFLTSSPIGIYRSDEPLDYSGFNPDNGMVEALKYFWVDGARCLLISAFPDEYSVNDRMRKDYEEIVKDTGLSLSCMDICDSRNGKEKADALHSYDFVILGGGHVPTESAFFARIGLADRFRGFEGIVMGISAGSMNCARIVYAQPELPGETADPSYSRFMLSKMMLWTDCGSWKTLLTPTVSARHFTRSSTVLTCSRRKVLQ